MRYTVARALFFCRKEFRRRGGTNVDHTLHEKQHTKPKQTKNHYMFVNMKSNKLWVHEVVTSSAAANGDCEIVAER